MPHGFPKVGSRERVFLEKLGVLGAKIQKFCVLRAEILPKNKAENAKFFKNCKWEGAHEQCIDCKLIGYGAPVGLKKGVMTAAHPHTPFLGQCCPPPPGGKQHVLFPVPFRKFMLFYSPRSFYFRAQILIAVSRKLL